MEEYAALYSAQGAVIGRAPRFRVPMENLRHGAIGVAVFNPQGRLDVHQRIWSKILHAGLFDFSAGGNPGRGGPVRVRRREAAEELGALGELASLGEAGCADAHAGYCAFRCWMIAPGPLELHAEQVLGAEWMEVSE